MLLTTISHDKQRKQGHTKSNEFNQSGITNDFELTAFYTIGSLHEFHESSCFQPTRIRLLSPDSQLSIELDRIFPNQCKTSNRHFMPP